VSQYCDIIAIRAFAGLVDKDKDNAETVAGFLKYATVPVVNMEGAPVTHYNPCRCDYHGRVQNRT
jgi:ornithine carbamoyltransferase